MTQYSKESARLITIRGRKGGRMQYLISFSRTALRTWRGTLPRHMLSIYLLCRIAALNRVTAEDRQVSVATLVIDSGREEGRVEGAEDEIEEGGGGSGSE
jgi:hypothetical protein